MAINTTGPISISRIVTEFGGTAPHSLSEYYRNGPFVTSNNTGIPTAGTISLSNFYGAVKLFIFNITEDVQQINLRTYLLARGWDGNAPVQLSLAAGRYLWSDSTAVPAVTTGTFPGGLVFTNNGFIMGKGGAGGLGGGIATSGVRKNGLPGGPALSAGTNFALINNGYVAGGGGGGAAGTSREDSGQYVGSGAGGGAGGGDGGSGSSRLSDGITIEGNFLAPGGAGGSIGQSGATGDSDPNFPTADHGGRGGGAGGGGATFQQRNMETDNFGGGGGGGRILPGVGGAGGATAGPGASGGSANNVGGVTSGTFGSGGGGWGAAGGNNGTFLGGAGGPAIVRNGFIVNVQDPLGRVWGAII